MTLKILGTGLLAATMFAAAPAMVSAETSTRSTECADLKGSTASLTRDDWAAWTKDQKDQKDQAAKPASTESAKEAGKPTTKELAEQYQELLRQEKAEPTGEQRQQSAARDTSATTGSAAPADRTTDARATDAADDPEAEANTPKANADGSEHFSAPSGGYSSGAHIGNESPTDTGNSAGGMEESKSAERMKQSDC